VYRSAKNTTTLGNGRVPTDYNDDDVRELLFSSHVLLPPHSQFYVTHHIALVHIVKEGYHLVVNINVYVKRIALTRGECTCGKSQSVGFDSVTSTQESLQTNSDY
jgi:hypothetical protein